MLRHEIKIISKTAGKDGYWGIDWIHIDLHSITWCLERRKEEGIDLFFSLLNLVILK